MKENCNINRAMLEDARKQFCLDINLPWEEYIKQSSKRVIITKSNEESRARLTETGARTMHNRDSFFVAMICMGQLFMMVDEQLYDWAVKEFQKCAPEWICKFKTLHKIDQKLQEYGRRIADTHIYYLPKEEYSQNQVRESKDRNEKNLTWYNQEELLEFKENNIFKSAICFSPTQPDVLAVAAMKPTMKLATELASQEKSFLQDDMTGMSGASMDGKYLWQIGIDVRDGYRGKGLAAFLVKNIKDEIIKRGITPFYGTSESHIISQTVALKTGFVPAWTEITAQK